MKLSIYISLKTGKLEEYDWFDTMLRNIEMVRKQYQAQHQAQHQADLQQRQFISDAVDDLLKDP